MTLLDLFGRNRQIVDWKKQLQKKTRQLVMGLSASTKALAIASSLEEQDKILVITSSQNEAERLASDLISLLREEKVYTFLADDPPLAEFVFSSQEKIFARLEAMNFLSDKEKNGILIINVAASRLFLPQPDIFKQSELILSVTEEYNLDNLVKSLSSNGYKKVSQVLSQGEYSLRGDILDIFERSAQYPLSLIHI